MTTTIAIWPGPFTATKLVPAALASLLTGEQNATLIQSRDKNVIEQCTWCLDLGEEGRRKTISTKSNPIEIPTERTEYWDDSKQEIPLGIAGYIWKHHGATILRERFGIKDEAKIECLLNKMYEVVFQAIDAQSLSIKRCDCTKPHHGFSFLSFNNIVGSLNPDWQGIEFSPARESERNKALQEAFERTIAILRDKVHYLSEEYYTGIVVMKEAFEDTECINKRILKLSRYIPWQSYIYDEEEARGMDDSNNILWVIFQDERSLQWRATSPASKGDRFKNRSLIHEDLRGLRDQELCDKVGVPEGCGFVHHTGFTCGGSSLEAVLRLIDYKGSNKN